jgi:broad specificity phosphatase PhoE
MRKDFYLFRHGETDYNVQKRWQGQSVDTPLNATGLTQANRLADYMKNINLEIIYSSPLQRASQTAKIVASHHPHIQVCLLSELTESSLGACEGLHCDEVQKLYPDIWQRWYGETTITDTRWPQGESKNEIQARMYQALEKMLKVKESIIGVSSHSGIMRQFLVTLGRHPNNKLPNTVLFHIVYDNGQWLLDPAEPLFSA